MDLKEFQQLTADKQLSMAKEAQYIASLIKAQHFNPLTDYGWFAAAPLPFNEMCVRNAVLVIPAPSIIQSIWWKEDKTGFYRLFVLVVFFTGLFSVLFFFPSS